MIGGVDGGRVFASCGAAARASVSEQGRRRARARQGRDDEARGRWAEAIMGAGASIGACKAD